MQLFDIVNVFSRTTFTSGHIVNQDQDVYNGLMQLTGEYQAVSGAVNTSSTPEVQYGYSSIPRENLMKSKGTREI